jgi:hypothetical protein
MLARSRWRFRRCSNVLIGSYITAPQPQHMNSLQAVSIVVGVGAIARSVLGVTGLSISTSPLAAAVVVGVMLMAMSAVARVGVDETV